MLAWGGVNFKVCIFFAFKVLNYIELFFKDAYDAAGLTQRHAEALKWGTDYFIGKD